MSTVLSVKDLKKVYPGKTPFVAVSGVSFELKQGEILGLLGPNGAGKTTTIQMLLGTLTPTSGSIAYFGKDFASHRSEIMEQVAFASTYVSLPWMLTVEQNLWVFAQLYGLSRSEFEERLPPFLEKFHLQGRRKSRCSSLSAGQITCLMLIKAFLMRAKIILLDEPTASLDPEHGRDVCHFLLEQREREGFSVLYTSHNMTEVAEICDRVLFLQNGKIIADDRPENLAKQSGPCRLQLVLAEGIEGVVKIGSEMKLSVKVDHRMVEIEMEEAQIASFLTKLAQASIVYSSIQVLQPTLADYFLRLVDSSRSKK